MIYRFGAYELDEQRFELRRDGARIEIQPKALELLLLLLRNRERVVTRAEVFEGLWPDSAVTEGSLARAVSLVRAALGDRGEQPTTIVTVPRRGYRFAAPVLESASGRSGEAAPAPEEPASHYVGRAALLSRLASQLDGALAGAGRILFLAGEAGIGKTRTAEWLARRSAEHGALVAAAWGSAAHAGWTQVLRALARRDEGAVSALLPAQRAALARLLPELRDEDAAAAPARSEDVERFALFDAVQAFLWRAAERAPLALFLDDLHAADADSILLLELVGQRLAAKRIAIVVTCREEDVARSPRQARAIERLLRVTALERWPLAGLPPAEVREFAEARLGAAAEPGLVEALERQTGGNPLLMAESLRSLEARDLLREKREARAWEALLPRGIRHLLLPKLRQLSPGASDALACAAVIGAEADLRVLEASVSEPAQLADRLGEAHDASLVLAAPMANRGPRFAHGLVREALYEELAPEGERRRALHARVWRAYEALTASEDDALSERAHHALEAVPLVPASEAAMLARKAAAHAAARFDFERAASWCERGLEKLSPAPAPDPALRIELLLGLGAAQVRALGLEPARASYREAADHARTLGRAEQLAAAALGFAHRPSSTGSSDGEAIGLLEEARRALPAGDEALRIRLLSRLAVELRYQDRPRAEQLTAEAVTAARRFGQPAVLTQALDDSSFVHWSPADTEAWIALNAEVTRLAHSCSDLELAFAGQRGLATGYLELGDRASLEREARSSERIADTLRIPFGRWYRAAHRALLALLDGSFATAERRIEEALAESDRIDSREVALEAVGQLVYLRMEQGRGAELAPAVRLQLERFPEMAVWRGALARILAGAGHASEAQVELTRLARNRFAGVARDRGYLPTLALAAEAARLIGDAKAASELEPLLAPYARLHAIAGSGLVYYGSVSHALGLVAATCGRLDEAVARFETALRAEETCGARLWAARTRVECARVLLDRGGAADRARAARWVGEAQAAAASEGWVELAAAARQLEAPVWTGRARPPRPSRPRASG